MSETISTTIVTPITLSVPTTITTTGAVVNSNVLAGAAISGPSYGFATLVNDGYISGSLFAVSFTGGGVLDVGAGGVIQALNAVVIGGSGVSTLVNDGTIAGSYLGVSLNDATITNQVSGRISGGIRLTNGTVSNAGTESGLISFGDGGVLVNTGDVAGFNGVGVEIGGAAGTITNQGQISSAYLADGGSISNSSSIGGVATAYGVNTAGAFASTVTNSGTIDGVKIQTGGTLINAAGGIIAGNIDGVTFVGAGSIVNQGNIFGIGGPPDQVESGDGKDGIAFNGSGQILNDAGDMIEGSTVGILLGSSAINATIVNHGSILANSSTAGIGIYDIGAGGNTILNYGLLSGSHDAAILAAGDTLILETGSTLDGNISAPSDATVEFATGTQSVTLTSLTTAFASVSTFINTGAALTLAGVNTLAPSAVFDNTGIILQPGTLDAFGTIANSGTLAGAVTLGGLYLVPFAPDASSAELINQAGGLITSTLSVAIAADVHAGSLPTTIVNDGTIADLATGGTAVAFNAGLSNLLIDDPGSVFIGTVDGGDAAGATAGSTLALAAGAATGTITGLGSSFTNFFAVSIAAGATWQIEDSSLTNFVDSGTAILDATNNLAGATIELTAGADVAFNQDTVASQSDLAFSGTDATLNAAPAEFYESVTIDMAAGGTIDLSDIAYDAAGQVNLISGNLLILSENDTNTTIHLNPSENLSSDFFHISSDGFDGTNIVESSVPCFLAGTRIATPTGERPVESLAIGDLVLTHDGAGKPIKWIGRRRYTAPFPENPDLIPVLIAAGALAPKVPRRELRLSPLHAVLIDGFLVPAGALINGRSVRSVTGLTEIQYYHIETEDHDIILAHNTPAETFIDEASRTMFDNAEEYFRLYPHAARLTAMLAAPRLEYGHELERIRRKVALRAGILLDQPAEAEVIGYLEQADRHGLTGWAFAPSQPNVPVSLEIRNRGALLARTIANIPRPDVKTAGFGTGRYGFAVTFPAPLPALQRHEISVRVAGTTLNLAGGPIVIDPGVPSELLQTGGLQSLIDAAVRSTQSPEQAAMLGSVLELAGQKILLTSARPAGASQRRREAGKPVVLLLDETWPTIQHDAGSNAVISHIAAFQALGYHVEFCATSGPPRDDAAQAGYLALAACNVTCHGQDASTAEAVIAELSRTRLDAVYLHRLRAASGYAGLVRHHAPQAFLIYAIADLHWLRLERQASVTNRPDLRVKAAAVAQAEIAAMRLVDCVLTHSRFEADFLRRSLPSINVHTVPWGVTPGKPASLKGRADIAFIGGAGHAPNLDAVICLADQIMPRVWQNDPTIKCLVAGAGWSANLFSRFDRRMVPLGHQPDLGTVLNSVRLTVAPLRFGAGLKGKVLASLAAGTPCVMSSVAAEGIPLSPLLSSVVGDGDAIAASILAVYRNKRTQRVLSAAGIDMITENFSPDHVVAALAQALGHKQAKPAITMPSAAALTRQFERAGAMQPSAARA
jgi:glycosyltransferase involved in cell wall biosynthesis